MQTRNEKGQFIKGEMPPTAFKKGHPKPKNAFKFPKGHTYNNGVKSARCKGGITKDRNYINFRKKERERKKRAAGHHTLGEWETLKAQYDFTCPHCKRREPFDGQLKFLTEDHIIPLSKGGSNNIENIQPLCHSCNSKKGAKILPFPYEK